MGNIVGSKGQVVIKKEIRDQLGIEPGWRTVQLVVDGHVELHFLPPGRAGSLAGILKEDIKRHLPTTDDLRAAREEAWIAMADEAMGFTNPDCTGDDTEHDAR